MPRGDSYMFSLFGAGASRTTVRARVLTNVDVASLSAALRVDAADYYYSSWISFLDAVQGINKGFCTWATVKLYYCAFYAFRASLAVDDLCVFNVGRPQFTVVSRAGASPVSCSVPGTHKAVMEVFQNENPGHLLLSQQISLQNAPDWMIDRREAANYGQGRINEPNCGAEFDFVLAHGLRRTINDYLADTS